MNLIFDCFGITNPRNINGSTITNNNNFVYYFTVSIGCYVRGIRRCSCSAIDFLKYLNHFQYFIVQWFFLFFISQLTFSLNRNQ